MATLASLTRKRDSKIDIILKEETPEGAELLLAALRSRRVWTSEQIAKHLSNAGYDIAPSTVRDWRRKNNA